MRDSECCIKKAQVIKKVVVSSNNSLDAKDFWSRYCELLKLYPESLTS